MNASIRLNRLRSLLFAAFAFGAAMLIPGIGSAQVVSNVQASIVNTKDALITYDVNDTRPEPLRIDLFFSQDGGTSWRAAYGALTGDIGSGIFKGNGKTIGWTNFAVDLGHLGGRQLLFRVLARREATVYVVQFADNVTSVTEGQGQYLAKVVVSLPFTGTVRYSISPMSNVVVGQASGNDISPLAGTVQFNGGTEAFIPISILDDLVIEDGKVLYLDLEFDELLGYTRGAKFRHIMMLYDDDGYWNGLLVSDAAESGFRMRILRQGATVQAGIVSDGNAAQNAGAFPPAPGDGVWDVTVNSFTSTSLNMVTEDIIQPGTNLFPGSGFKRKVTLNSSPAPSSPLHTINTFLAVSGGYTDVIDPIDAALVHLHRETSGIMYLVRQIPVLNVPESPSFPIPDNYKDPAPVPRTAPSEATK